MRTVIIPECDFDDYFPEGIKWKGYQYFKEGRVELVREEEDTYYGIVHGSQDYEVSFKYDEGDVTQMHCTCPFFAKGVNCKHLYAFIFSEFGEERTEQRYTSEEMLYTKPIEETEEEPVKPKKGGLLSVAKGIVGALNSFNDAFENETKKEQKLEDEMDIMGLDEDEKDLVRNGEWEPWEFEEDEREEDDYYHDDDL